LSSGRVLVVDDEPQIRRIMRTALTGAGYEIDDAKTGEEALEKIREFRPDLVLLDINMPGMGGLAACREIRADTSIANVLADAPPHLEQAVFADELCEESMAAFREIAKTQWQALLAATVPALQVLVDADAAKGAGPRRRVRIGLYTYHEAMTAPAAAASAPASPARRRTPVRKKDR